MTKIFRYLLILAVFTPAVYLALAWQQLPSSVPMHYNIHGEIDRMGSKNELIGLVAMMSAISLGVGLLLANIHRIDPRRYGSASPRFAQIGFGIAVFMAAIQCIIIFYAGHPGLHFDGGFILAAVAILFAFLGNYMPNLKPNYFAGIRIPWTLDDPDNWKKTHALAGKLWFAGGLLLAITSLALPTKIAVPVFFAGIVILVLVPCIYSYQLFKKSKEHV